MQIHTPSIAILIPCKNEADSVGDTVRACQAAVPQARIVVGDNNSTDGTADMARAAGAEVLTCPTPGKGAALRHLLAHVQSDIYAMIDGDNTYEAKAFQAMLPIVIHDPSIVVTGVRDHADAAAYPAGHQLGNWGLNAIASLCFGGNSGDLLSGQRVFSRQFLQVFQAQSNDFRIETEMTAAAVAHQKLARVPTHYGARKVKGTSKLKTIPDGFRVLFAIMHYGWRIRTHQSLYTPKA